MIHIHRTGEEIRRIVVPVAIVLMQGNIVGHLVGMLQRHRFPFRERGHRRVGAAAGHQLNLGIDQPHRLRRLIGEPAVFLRRLLADLPRTIHLIAQTPGSDLVRLLITVASTQIAPVASSRMVAVFQQVAGRINAAGSQIHRHHDFGTNLLGPSGKLVRAYPIRFNCPPGQLQALRPRLNRANPILPVISGDEIPAGIPDDWDIQLFHQLLDVVTESLRICCRMRRLINPSVDGPAQMFNKGAVNAPIYFRNFKSFVDDHRCSRCC